MVRYVLSGPKTKSRGEKTIKKAIILGLLEQERLSAEETPPALMVSSGARRCMPEPRLSADRRRLHLTLYFILHLALEYYICMTVCTVFYILPQDYVWPTERRKFTKNEKAQDSYSGLPSTKTLFSMGKWFWCLAVVTHRSWGDLGLPGRLQRNPVSNEWIFSLS